MTKQKIDYLAHCPAKWCAFHNTERETQEDVVAKVNEVLERDPMLRRAVLSRRTSGHALRMALVRAGMLPYLYVDPQTNRSVLLFGRKAYVRTPEQFLKWMDTYESIRKGVHRHTR